MASESGTLNSLGFELVGDVQPGSALLLPRAERSCTTHDCLPSDAPARPMHAPCVFEYVYFARPDSVLDGVSVYRTRLRMGEKLAQNILRHVRPRRNPRRGRAKPRADAASPLAHMHAHMRTRRENGTRTRPRNQPL